MRAFVTGGTGFVGANLVRALLADGCVVRAMIRPSSDLRNLDQLPVELVEGNLDSPGTLCHQVEDCDVIFHAAAVYSLWRRDKAEIYRVNVEGTRHLLSAAHQARVPRFVFTSSVAAIGVPPPGRSATEETRTSLSDLVSDYKKSKFLAEQAALEAARAGLDVVIVNPSTPIGPYDIKPTPTGEIIVRFLEGRMPFYVDTGLNLIDVRDVALGHILAWQRGRTGERYILGNRNLSFKALLEMLEGLTGRRAPRRSLPHAIPLFAAYADEMILAKLPGWHPTLAYSSVKMSRKAMFYDASKAVRELGLPQNPIEPALSLAIEWFLDQGSGIRGQGSG